MYQCGLNFGSFGHPFWHLLGPIGALGATLGGFCQGPKKECLAVATAISDPTLVGIPGSQGTGPRAHPEYKNYRNSGTLVDHLTRPGPKARRILCVCLCLILWRLGVFSSLYQQCKLCLAFQFCRMQSSPPNNALFLCGFV